MSTDKERAVMAKADAAAAFKAQDYVTAAALFARSASLGGEDAHALHCNRGARLCFLCESSGRAAAPAGKNGDLGDLLSVRIYDHLPPEHDGQFFQNLILAHLRHLTRPIILKVFLRML